jgi:hypothetical protein
MKYIISLVLLFSITATYAQKDKNGNPVFNSITTNTESINDFQLLSNYYTLKNNIENSGSSVYINDKPSLKDIEKAAIELPSDFFLILKKSQMVALILILNKPERSFLVVDPGTGNKTNYLCALQGDISENRANEIIKEAYDPNATIKEDKLFFNNKGLTIIKNTAIKEQVVRLIDQNKLTLNASSKTTVLSKEDLKAMILKESKEGGKMDFFTEIKGHEYDGLLIKPGLFATKGEIALYKWGRANFEFGVNTVEDALAIWAEFKERPANTREANMITKGFNKDLEK